MMNLHEKHILWKQYLFLFCGITLWTVKWVLHFQQLSKCSILCHKHLDSVQFLLERRLVKETNYWFSSNNSMLISNLLGLVLNYCRYIVDYWRPFLIYQNMSKIHFIWLIFFNVKNISYFILSTCLKYA